MRFACQSKVDQREEEEEEEEGRGGGRGRPQREAVNVKPNPQHRERARAQIRGRIGSFSASFYDVFNIAVATLLPKCRVLHAMFPISESPSSFTLDDTKCIWAFEKLHFPPASHVPLSSRTSSTPPSRSLDRPSSVRPSFLSLCIQRTACRERMARITRPNRFTLQERQRTEDERRVWNPAQQRSHCQFTEVVRTRYSVMYLRNINH